VLQKFIFIQGTLGARLSDSLPGYASPKAKEKWMFYNKTT